jgi:hypothetical protein
MAQRLTGDEAAWPALALHHVAQRGTGDEAALQAPYSQRCLHHAPQRGQCCGVREIGARQVDCERMGMRCREANWAAVWDVLRVHWGIRTEGNARGR